MNEKYKIIHGIGLSLFCCYIRYLSNGILKHLVKHLASYRIKSAIMIQYIL